MFLIFGPKIAAAHDVFGAMHNLYDAARWIRPDLQIPHGMYHFNTGR